MDQNNMIYKVISVLHAIVIAVCAAGCAYVFAAGKGLYFSVSAVVEFLALVFAVVYFIMGFKKNASDSYRYFMLFYAFTYLAQVTAGVFSEDSIGISSRFSAVIVFSMILYGNNLILAVGKDLGKGVSYALCTVTAVFCLLPAIAYFIPGMIEYDDPSLRTPTGILYVTRFVMAANAFIMTTAKYADKKARGTK